MILVGNQRGNAKELALHLLNEDDNENVILHQLRGFVSTDLMGALNEAYAISRGTKCEKYLYSLSFNPPKGATASIADFEKAIEDAEARLGLTGQPRAIVFHEKHGRLHAHAVWSRIDIQKMKAIHIAYDHEKLNRLSHELFLRHGWELPKGYEDRAFSNPLNFTHAQHQQAMRTGKSAAEIKHEIQEAWAGSDDRASFEQALAEKCYFLARGDKRGFVVIDLDGEIYSLPKQLPKGINTKQVRAKLGDPEYLPSVDDILALLAEQQPEQPAFTKEDALKRITRFHSAFTPKMMERTLKPKIKDQMERQSMIYEIMQSGDLIEIGKQHGHTLYSTKEMLELEQSLLHIADTMAQTSSHMVEDAIVDQAVCALNAQLAEATNGIASLSDQQIRAMKHIASNKQLSLLVGVAGAGKTTIMQGAKDMFEARGYRVRGIAPSGIAAGGLREAGVNAGTLHSLLARIDIAEQMIKDNHGKPLSAKQTAYIKSNSLSKHDVLILDEAGMVSAKHMHRLMSLCQRSGAKLLLVGDPQQLQSIEAGTAFKDILRHHDCAKLDEVRRQQPPWQQKATLHLSKAQIGDALRAYERHQCLTSAKTRTGAKETLVADYMRDVAKTPQASRLVLAYTRKDVADLNNLIKAEMVKHGIVAEKDVSVTITEKDGDDDIERQERFAVGDRILFRENNRDMGVMNGTFGTLKYVKGDYISVVLDNGNTVSFSHKDYNRFQLGYATTVHKSQGATVDKSYVLATPHFNQHTTYVAMSRHKHDARLYYSRTDFKTPHRLYASLGKQSEKISTLEFTDSRQPSREKAITPDKHPSLSQRIRNSATHLWQRLRGKEVETSKTETKPYIPPQRQHPTIQQRDQFLQNTRTAEHNHHITANALNILHHSGITGAYNKSDLISMRNQALKHAEAGRQQHMQIQQEYEQDRDDNAPRLEW